MPKLARQRRRKAIRNTLAFGALSTALYVALFLNQGTVMTYFTKGGIYAALPVATAFLFSFVHGAFTGNFLSALGIEPSKKVTRIELTPTKPVERKSPRARMRLRA